MTSPAEIALLRLAAQRIAGAAASPSEVVERLTAMQGQERTGAVTAIALRTASRSRATVEAAFDAGQIVRAWPMRGTLHVVAAQDLSWILGLTAARTIAGASARRAALELADDELGRARRLVEKSLTGGGQRTRSQLMALFEQHGLKPSGGRGYHILFHLAQLGVICFGPVQGSEQLVVLAAEWTPRPRVLDRDDALGELALRYFRGHGPATVKDFGRWTGLVAADVRTGLAIARPELATLRIGGIEYLMDPCTPEFLQRVRSTARGVFLLPGFDEFMLGYQDRSASLRLEFANHIVPGGNGVFRPTLVSDGQVVGTWAQAGRGAKRALTVTPFTTLTAKVEAAIPRVFAALP